MLKRIVAATAVLIVLVSGYAWLIGDQASADSNRVIPILASDSSRIRKDAKVGDSCGIYADFPRLFLTKQQIVVKDQDGSIVAVKNLEGVLEEGIFESELKCDMKMEINVPDAEFYTVYVGETRIMAFSAGQFPIDPLDGVWINFE